MTTPDRKPLTDLRTITEARLTLGPRGRAPDTATALQFALDHARAREAVTSELDVPAVTSVLASAWLEHRLLTSAAGTRDTFIKRPDLGRLLPEGEAEALRSVGPIDVALVLGDGLSAVAVALNGGVYMAALAEMLTAQGLRVGPVILARQARVALGDKIALAMGADTVVMALGERPGMSAADSLGVYVTHAPTQTTPDSARNCISNIREAGLPIPEAVAQTEALIRAMRATGLSGVALNQSRAAGVLPGGE